VNFFEENVVRLYDMTNMIAFLLSLGL
jgi:hypothetical protein